MSYRAEQREAILDEFERSGLKGAAFARMTGLQYQTFASWIQRRRHERGDYQMAATTLKESRRPVPVVRLMEAVSSNCHPNYEGKRMNRRKRQSVSSRRPEAGGRVMVQYLETALGLVPTDGKPLPPRLERVR